MAKRSPILGYNHNIRHLGLVFHVQTEDSGVDHPHIFTHLFFGGVIIDTRKLDYDPEASEESVKSLMQAQHKASLKRLKHGEFNDKIYQYFGDNPDLAPRDGQLPAADEVPAEQDDGAPDSSDVSAAFEKIQEDEIEAPAIEEPPPAEVVQPAAPEPTAVPHHGVHSQETVPVRARPAGKARRIADRAGETGRSGGPSVVVSRPAVIIGAPSKVVGGKGVGQPSRASGRTHRFAREQQTSRPGLFGKDLVSEKSLDEVILAYLSEDGSEE